MAFARATRPMQMWLGQIGICDRGARRHRLTNTFQQLVTGVLTDPGTRYAPRDSGVTWFVNHIYSITQGFDNVLGAQTAWRDAMMDGEEYPIFDRRIRRFAELVNERHLVFDHENPKKAKKR